MKSLITMILTVLFAILAVVPDTFAQDVSQQYLPEGATTRLGKGTIEEVAYSPDGTRLAVASSIGIWLYDPETYREVALLVGHTDRVNSVAFSPDSSRIASGSWDETVRLWDAKTEQLLQNPRRAYGWCQ